jgi:hypothetical protein
MLHNGRFCNGGITKQCLNNSKNVPYNDLFYNCSITKAEINQQFYFFSRFLNNMGFLIEGAHKIKDVL